MTKIAKRKILIIAATAAMIFGAWSCDDDPSISGLTDNSQSSSDCAITSATIGLLTRTVHAKTTSGNDTTYTVSIAGSAYPLYIDQQKQEIYNQDSLPVNTDITKVVLSALTGDGLIYRRTTYGNDTLFSTTDTLDFTNPQYVTCYSTDGQQSKTYKITINVHTSNSEEFSWNTAVDENPAFKDITEQKAFIKDRILYVFAKKAGQPIVIQTDTANLDNWTSTNLNGFSDFRPRNTMLFHDTFYTSDNGTLMRSANGTEWEKIPTSFTVTSLVAVGKNELYAQADGYVYYTFDGTNWQPDSIANNGNDFPTTDFASAWSAATYNDNFSYILLVGKQNGNSSLWKKTVDDSGQNTEPWVFFPRNDSGLNNLPTLSQTALFSYDAKILCVGLDGNDISNFYISTDGGRNWIEQTDNLYNRPDGLKAESFSVFVDENNFVWMICAPSGKVVKGKLNRLAYSHIQRVFN